MNFSITAPDRAKSNLRGLKSPAAPACTIALSPPPNAATADPSREQSAEDAEEDRARKRLRYAAIEALEAAEWSVQINGENLILGDGRVYVEIPSSELVLLYAPIEDVAPSADLLVIWNTESRFGTFVSGYRNANGDRIFGAFQRVRIPDPLPSIEELTRWLDASAMSVAVTADQFREFVEAVQ